MANGSIDELLTTCATATGPTYIAARDAVRAMGASALPALEARRAETDWRMRTAVEILLGWLQEPELYESAVPTARGEVPAGSLAPLTGRYPATRRATALAAAGGAIVPRLIELATRSPELHEGDARAAVLLALEYLRDERAVLPLLALVETPAADPGVQLFALSALGSTGDARAADVALAAFRDRSRPAPVRGAAIACLGRLRDSRVAAEASAAARNTSEPASVRESAVYALGAVRTPAAAAALAALLQTRPDEPLALATIAALGQHGSDPVATAALEELGRTHTLASVRRAAQDARDSAIA
jgi:HEAT repeat protein